MSEIITQHKNDGAQGEGLMRGGLGFLAGLLLCGVAMAAQAALLHTVARRATKAS